MRHRIVPVITALTAAAALAPAAGARPAPPDVPVPPQAPEHVITRTTSDGGLDAGWAVLLAGGAAAAGAAAGFAGARVRHTAPRPS